MKQHDDDDCSCWGSLPRLVLRMVISVVVLVVVLSIVFSVLSGVFGIASGVTLIPEWAWAIIGLIVALWVLGWLFRLAFRPWGAHGEHWMRSGRRETGILRRRYARGEITRSQFKTMMKDLKDED